MRSVLALCFLISLGCAKKERTEKDPADVKRAIHQANGQFIAAYEKGQASAIAELYAPDATVIQANIEPVRGRDRIEKQFINLFDQSKFRDVRLQSADIRVSGSMAYEFGKYALTVSPLGMTPAPVNGNYVVVWQLQPDDSWKILIEMRQPNI